MLPLNREVCNEGRFSSRILGIAASRRRLLIVQHTRQSEESAKNCCTHFEHATTNLLLVEDVCCRRTVKLLRYLLCRTKHDCGLKMKNQPLVYSVAVRCAFVVVISLLCIGVLSCFVVELCVVLACWLIGYTVLGC